MGGFDIEKVLTDITPDAPSGESELKDDAAFVDLEITIEGTPEREFDGKIVQEAKDPNWNQVQAAAVGLLGRTHDLRVVMFLTRALLHTNGFDGLASALRLLHGFVERYWDSLYPQLDPEDNHDPTERINILAALGEGEDILVPLKKIPLCASRTLGQYGFRDIQIASGKIDPTPNDKSPPPDMADIEAAFKDTDVQNLLGSKSAIQAALNNLINFRTELTNKAGEAYARIVPDFSGLHKVLMEMNTIFEKQLEGRELPQPEGAGQSAENGAEDQNQPGNSGSPKAKAVNVIHDRQDVIRLLDQICKYYQYNEPGSPVPLLLKRARHLVEKNFLEIIEDLAPDSADKMKNLISGVSDDGS